MLTELQMQVNREQAILEVRASQKPEWKQWVRGRLFKGWSSSSKRVFSWSVKQMEVSK